MSVCITPFYVNHKTINDLKIPVPCGKCPPCFARRTSHWSFRLRQEGKQHRMSSFVTLTYETQNLPKSQNGFSTLSKTDIQKFFKRLRKFHEKRKLGSKIIYYVAGEYGSTYKRPHYHIILFNAFNDDVIRAWSLDNKPIGFVHFGNISDASIGYTLKYISKKLINKKTHARDDRQKEFQLCSKGIGLAYLTDAIKKWHRADPADRCYAVIEDGKKISLPRYFRDKIFDDNDKALISDKLSSIAMEKEYQLYLEHGSNVDEYNTKTIIDQLWSFNKKISSQIDKF